MPGKITADSHPIGRLAGQFYTDRRLIVLTLLLAVAAGTSSLMVLPRMEDPQLTQRAANIVTLYPGADADRVEALVTEKIEEQLIDIPEIKRIRSQSRAGSSLITVELRDEIYETDPIWSQVRGKIEESISEIPAEAGRPQFEELDVTAYAWIGAVVWKRDGSVANGVMRRLARELKDEFFLVQGTKKVDLYGDPAEEIIVELDPDRLASAGLSAGAVALQLRDRDAKRSAGMLRGDQTEFVVELENQFESIEDILNASLRTDNAGQSLTLGDLADVRRTTMEPPSARAIVDGNPGIVIGVLLRSDYRIDHWTADATATIDGFRERLPSGVELDILMEQDRYVSTRMSGLMRNLLMGVSAVAIVTLIFMGWRSSLLVTATLPVASLMVLAGMRVLDIPIHQMSVTGLIIALGLLIDNAIIATDEIDLSLRRGLTPVEAVVDMVSRLFAPLLASTVTTALAFAPIALMEGPAGEFVGSIALTVILAIFSSFFLAMTVLPSTAAWLQRGLFPDCDKKRDEQAQTEQDEHKSFIVRMLQHGVTVPWITASYRKFLVAMLARPWLGILFGALFPILGFISASRLDEQFFPPADRDQFHIELELEPQASLANTEQVVRAIDAVLVRQPRVSHTAWFLGESAPSFYYNIISRRKNSPNYAQAMISLDNNDDSLEMIRRLQLELDEQFPSVRVLVRQLEQGPPFDAPVEIRVFGSDLDRLKDYGEQVRTLASTIPDVLHSRTALNDIRPVASINVSSQEASWTGLSEDEVGRQLFASFEGIQAGSIIEEVEEIPVRVRLAGPRRSTLEDVTESSLLISTMPTPGGLQRPPVQRNVPVSAVAAVTLKPQRAVITRYNGRRVNEVQTFITAGTLPSIVLGKLQQKIDATELKEVPAGYSLEVGGEASERDAAVSRLMANVSVLAVGMVAALVLALASFRLAGLIGLVATLAIGLGMGALWVFDFPFGFMAIVGTMGLVGIAINDSIVVVAALAARPEIRAGDMDATVDTVVEVTRHVLATTATTVVGFLPLLLSGGGFWPPLAVAIGTGVTGATLISLTLVPSAFRLMGRANSRPAAVS